LKEHTHFDVALNKV